MNVNKKGIIEFLFITFGFGWAIWGIPLLFGTSIRSSNFSLFQTVGAFVPAAAAYYVRSFVTQEGFKDSGLNTMLKQNWRHYLFALLLPLAVTGVIVFLTITSGLGQPDLSLKQFSQEWMPGDIAPVASFSVWVSMIFFLIVISLFVALVAFGEELGWRGYLQIKLFSGRPLLAAILTGLIWGIWYLPLNLAGYNYPNQPLLGLVVFPVSTILLSIVYGWLFLTTGSIVAPCLANAATVTIGVSLTQILFGEHSDLLFTGYFGILGWIPLGVVCAWIILTGKLKRVGFNKPPEEKKKSKPEPPEEEDGMPYMS